MADLSSVSDGDLDSMIAAKQAASSHLSSLSDADLDKAIAAKQPSASAGDTALEHFGKGASLGYLPQLQAAAQKYIGDPVLNAMYGKDNVTPTDYVSERDQNIARLAKEAKDNPKLAKASDLAGGLTTGIATSGLLPEAGAASTIGGKIAQGAIQGAKTGAILGAAANPGDTEGELSPLQLLARTKNAGVGAAAGGVIGGALPVVGAGVNAGANAISNKLKDFAEKTAVNATGATGKQATTFSDDAGRELLDRGIVRFGDSQAKISQRAADAVDQANAQIDSSLKQLEAQGVKVDGNTVYNTVRGVINKMKMDPSNADIAGNLEKELDNLVNASDAKGTSDFGIQEAEQIKRGYGRKAGNWADPEKGQAGKTMYQTIRGAVEDAATDANPDLAQQFIDAKQTHGLLAPIQEAAERRAATTSQSPAGGFNDLATAAVGMAKAGPVGAIVAPVARRVIAPRIASSLAVTADGAADLLRKIPEIANLEGSNPAAFQQMVSRIATPGENTAATIPAAQNQTAPTKGPEKWMADGYSNLMQHASTPEQKAALEQMREKLMNDKNGKKLLTSASDMTPGTKGMQNIMDQVQQLNGAKN